MTESEWAGCSDPRRMLRFVRFGSGNLLAGWWARLSGKQGRASPRKLALLALACYRRAGLVPAGHRPEGGALPPGPPFPFVGSGVFPATIE